jgi:hypothetical protein
MNDRPSDEVGKEGDEYGVGEQALLFGDTLTQIDQIRDLSEGEEGYAKREKNLLEAAMDEPVMIEEIEQRKEILEPHQEKQIANDSGGEPTAANFFAIRSTDEISKEEINGNRAE